MTKHIDVSQNVVDFLLSHLNRELTLLDVAIDSAAEVKKILRAQGRDSSPDAGHREGELIENSGQAFSIQRNQQVQLQLGELQNRIAHSAGPIVDSRKVLTAELARIDPKQSSPSLKQVAANVAEPARSELFRLRKEVRERLAKFQAISMSNQTVLVYSLDYYSQLLGSSNRTNGYDASGHAQSHSKNFRYNEAG